MRKNWDEKIRDAEIQYAEQLEEISHYLFQHPELGGEEEQSCAYLTEFMRAQGFQVTCPYGGEKTGFRAEAGIGEGPVIAFIAEYDALPGYGEHGEPGHACGHNWIAATTAGAAAVTASLLKEGLHGKVVLIGTPAEESYGGKVTIIENGGFGDVDVAIQAHLDETTEAAPSALAMTSMRFGFTGKAAHAAQFPHEGINALDAVQLTFAGINALRQHVTPDVRIHGIVVDGGAAANIVPAHSSCEFFVRAASRATAEAVTERLINCVRGASLMTGAKWAIERQDPMLYDMINLPLLVELAGKNLRKNGIERVHRDQAPMPGSSDIGNLSYVCPTAYMEIALSDEVSFLPHDQSALEYADSPEAARRLHEIVNTMSGMAVELMENPELVERAKQEHTEILSYHSRK